MACIQHSRNALWRIIAKETNLKSSDGAINPLLYACQGVRYKKLEVILTTVSVWLGNISFLGFLSGYVSVQILMLMLDFYLHLQSIEKLGKAGQTVKVAPGHFRNHLMPKLLAVPNIEKFAHLIREQRKVLLKFLTFILSSPMCLLVFFYVVKVAGLESWFLFGMNFLCALCCKVVN